MTGGASLGVGLALGMLHAGDADHVVAMATMLDQDTHRRRTLRLAMAWGIGHAVTFVAVACAIIVYGWQVPARFEGGAHLAVGLLLVGFGLGGLSRACRGPMGASGWRVMESRATLAGLVHGLSGSAAIALVGVATIPSQSWAMFYVLLFALGTVIGMVALTLTLAWSIARAVGRRQAAFRWIRIVTALWSMGLGITFLLRG